MPEARKYTGGCHCGKVRYEVTAELSKVTECNCSICSRRGWSLMFATSDQFNLLSGKDALTDYQFGKKHIHHTFCSTCGVASFAHGDDPGGQTMYAVNVRCLDDVDLSTLEINKVDGRSR